MTHAPAVSFEFFPPRDLDASFRLWDAVTSLAPYSPDFVSVTYGAGGTTRRLTHEAVAAISANTRIPVAAHLTCVDASREETMAVVDGYEAAGVRKVVALRGDAPKGAGGFRPREDGYADSVALIAALAERGGMDVLCGAYPEPHPDGTGTASDIAWLKRKQDAGAAGAITQFFFDQNTFLRFRDEAVRAGVTIPIIPGVLPIRSWEGAVRFAARCGARVPDHVLRAFEAVSTPEDERRVAVDLAAYLCRSLIREGVGHVHFYTLNSPDLTAEVCDRLGVGRVLKAA